MAFAAICVIVAVGLLGPGLPVIPRRLLRAVSVYALVVFVARPVYLLLANPIPSPVNPVADPLLLTPTYAGGIEHVGGIILIGQATFLIAWYVIVAGLRRRLASIQVVPPQDVGRLVALYALSWVCRLADYAHLGTAGGPSVAVLRLAPLGTALLVFCVVSRDWRSSPSARRLVLAMTLGELIWSVLDASKTPLIGAGFAFYLDPARPQWSFKGLITGFAGILFSFGVIEQLKPGASGHASSGPAGLLVSFLSRFDMLHAVAVAKLYGVGSYMSVSRGLLQMVSGLLPQQLLGIQRLNDGQNWAVIMEQVTYSVSVSTGPVAEGYAIGGIGGIVVSECFTAAAFAVTVAVVFRRDAFWLPLVAAYVLASAAPFEQGPIGIVEVLSGAVQASLIAAVVGSVLPRRSVSQAAVPLGRI